jgi:predicted GNAT superfamily acetyltransferase
MQNTHEPNGLTTITAADEACILARAESDGHSMICCEVNVDPPNPASDAFHASLGFHEIGRASMANGKVVRYTKAIAAEAKRRDEDGDR